MGGKTWARKVSQEKWATQSPVQEARGNEEMSDLSHVLPEPRDSKGKTQFKSIFCSHKRAMSRYKQKVLKSLHWKENRNHLRKAPDLYVTSPLSRFREDFSEITQCHCTLEDNFFSIRRIPKGNRGRRRNHFTVQPHFNRDSFVVNKPLDARRLFIMFVFIFNFEYCSAKSCWGDKKITQQRFKYFNYSWSLCLNRTWSGKRTHPVPPLWSSLF